MYAPYLLFVQRVNGIKTARLVENTISAEQGDVVSRKWYREGYFIEEGGVLTQIQFVQADDNRYAADCIQLAVDVLDIQHFEFAGNS